MQILYNKNSIKTYEEDFEEIGNIVPYRVELADTNCQQR